MAFRCKETIEETLHVSWRNPSPGIANRDQNAPGVVNC
jgi:hypothetical protein